MNPVGFLFPLVLAAVPVLVAALVIAYRRRGRGRKSVVSSLLILEKLERRIAARKRVIPPLRFFFEALLLCALIAGVAGLFVKEKGRKVALVIDNSFSTFAQSQEYPEKKVIDIIREEAGDYLERLPGGSSVLLLTTDSDPAAASFEAVWKVQERLETLAPAYASDDMPLLIATARSKDPAAELQIFSDRSIERDATSEIKVRTVPPNASNVVISGITAQEAGVIKVTLTSYSDSEWKGTIELDGFHDGRYSPIETMQVVLPAHAEREFIVPRTAPDVTSVRASIHETGSPRIDALQEDNTRYLTFTQPRQQVTIVSDLSAKALGLDLLPGYSVSAVPPADFVPSTTDEGFAIFHRTNVPELPNGNALFILPPAGGEIKVEGEPRPAAVSRWNGSHPVLSYLKPSTLELPLAQSLSVPAWAEAIITGEAGALAFAGESGGHRYVALGFELLPYRGKESPFLSILTLNLLRWLGQGGLAEDLMPRRPYALKSTPLADERVSLSNGFTTFSVPGIFKVENPAGTVAVNFYRPEESNLRMPPVSLSQLPLVTAESTEAEVDYVRLLLLGVLGLVCLDMLIAALLALRPGRHFRYLGTEG